MTNLSSKAEAVITAAGRRYAVDGDLRDSVAAADAGVFAAHHAIYTQLLAIAAELEDPNA